MNKEYRIQIDLTIRFRTAFHLGSGIEGEGGTDNGIIVDERGIPILPGSSLKGIYRSTVEKLLPSLENPKLWACGLQNGLYHKDNKCIGGGFQDKEYKEAHQQFQNSNGQDISLIEKNRCTVCSLFGSPLSAGRVYMDDAYPTNTEEFVLQRRDGVGLSRDSGTAIPSVKYDYDVANAGLEYKIALQAEDVSEEDWGILALGILEWKHAGLKIGGKTTRGLGSADLEKMTLRRVNLSDANERKNYMIRGQMVEVGDAEAFLQEKLSKIMV